MAGLPAGAGSKGYTYQGQAQKVNPSYAAKLFKQDKFLLNIFATEYRPLPAYSLICDIISVFML